MADAPPPAEVVAPPVDYEASFIADYQRMHAPLISYAERFLGKDDAADAVGDAMEAIWCRWPMVVREKRGDGYYFSAVHYTIRAMMESNARYVSLEDAEEELERLAFDQSPQPTRGETRSEIVARVIAAMPPRRREVVLLLKEQGLTYVQAAEVLGLSLGTINTHIRLANEDMRAAVAQAAKQIAPPQQLLLPSPKPSPKGGETND